MFAKSNLTCRALVAATKLNFGLVSSKFRAQTRGFGSGYGSSRLPSSEMLINRWMQVPGHYNSTEALVYDMAVKNFFRQEDGGQDQPRDHRYIKAMMKAKKPEDMSPLFGTILGYKAVNKFLSEVFGLDTNTLEIHEHFFQQLTCPMPPRSEIKTIVQLADIVCKDHKTLFVVDALTYDESYTSCLVFNQFCFIIPECPVRNNLKDSDKSRRLVHSRFNPYDDILPNHFYKIQITSAQDSVLSKLADFGHPMQSLTDEIFVKDHQVEKPREHELHEKLLPHVFGVEDFELPPLSYIGSFGTVADSVIRSMRIPYPRLKGIKVIRGPKALNAGDDLEVCAWKLKFDLITDKMVFFHSFNLTSERFDVVHYGYITLY